MEQIVLPMTPKCVLISALVAVALTVMTVADGPRPASAQDVSGGLVRGPYLQQPREDSMTILWADRSGTAQQVRYGLHWSSVGFDDAGWRAAHCGRNGIDLAELTDTRGRRLPTHARHTAELKNVSTIEQASLLLRTDGDFVAYLNGCL